ncbi:putative alpha-ketoglutarate-dependent taurine dioxygenase [Coleophoma crateriformis]|uniref:Putative alpha-ketoglutarate-dependent taurine dioxygenase n=1 Tax=Coleophoma crateriformis TaxID=565419 RepID=A0A3D8S303_9HELO|nr:putative alpha-ketoglutarate-dependent taurine dioxygenase [Coleophoma crateriformis]
MAPSLEVRYEATASTPHKNAKSALSYTPGRATVQTHENYPHEDLKPYFPQKHWAPLEEVPYIEKGLLGSPNFDDLLSNATKIFDYNPKIGTEIEGVDLANLTDAAKNDLARLISVRGVVFFRNQKNLTIDAQRDLGRYFGTLHKHATTSVPKRGDLDDVHVVYNDENSKDQRSLFTPTFLWHADVTYEIQPPSYTSLRLLSGPPNGAGGDTLWSSQYAAYDALSGPMQKYLESLTALHSAQMQADNTRAAGRTVRRDPVITEHPLIRSHPVTGWKSLFFNPGFVTAIKGIPKIESDAIIKLLNEVVSTTQEGMVRFRWQEGDVAFWDNRITNHSASYGFAPHRRHAVRVACQAERPYLDPEAKSQEEDLAEQYGLLKVNKDGSRQSNYND